MDNEVMKLIHRLDAVTLNHSIRVMAIAMEIEDYYDMSTDTLSKAALLHDIGKIYIPHSILNKKATLDDLERKIIDLHPYIGYELLENLQVDEAVNRIVLYHHGFSPVTLRDISSFENDEIIIKSQMLRTIDVFEALTSERPYHKGIPAASALKKLDKMDFAHPDVMDYISGIIYSTSTFNSAVRRDSRMYDKGSLHKLLSKAI